MASTLNASTSSGLISSGDTSGVLQLQTANTTALTVDGSQNIGIGTTTPTDSDSFGRFIDLNGTNGAAIYTRTNGSATQWTELGNYFADGYLKNRGAGSLIFNNNAAERMRIDSSGNLLVGTTGISTGSFKGIQCGVNSGGFPNYLSNNPAGTANRNWSFGMNNADQFAVYGYNTTTFNTGAYIAWGGTSWTASSDERKKDIIEPIENGLQKVFTLRAVIGKYKTDEEGTRRSFLIAQDLQAVLPEAVDASNPDDLGVQYTEVIPLLVSAIKELKAINDTQAETINALTARIVALEK